MWSSLHPSCLGLSVLPELICLFLHQIREVICHFFQISFQFLALSLPLLAPLWFKCWYFWRCPRSFLAYPWVFLDSFFFLLFWFNVFFFLMFQIIDLILFFISSTVGSLCKFFFFLKILLFVFFREGERRKKKSERNTSVWLPLTCPPPDTWPTTQACALTGNRTGDPSVRRLVLSPLSHTSQGRTIIFGGTY